MKPTKTVQLVPPKYVVTEVNTNSDSVKYKEGLRYFQLLRSRYAQIKEWKDSVVESTGYVILNRQNKHYLGGSEAQRGNSSYRSGLGTRRTIVHAKKLELESKDEYESNLHLQKSWVNLPKRIMKRMKCNSSTESYAIRAFRATFLKRAYTLHCNDIQTAQRFYRNYASAMLKLSAKKKTSIYCPHLNTNRNWGHFFWETLDLSNLA